MARLVDTCMPVVDSRMMANLVLMLVAVNHTEKCCNYCYYRTDRGRVLLWWALPTEEGEYLLEFSFACLVYQSLE
jgi:hypothetical protein